MSVPSERFTLSVVPLRNMCALDSFYERPQLEPDDFYYSSEGYIIFTAKYLLKRGYCCKNGCKHCPYGYDKGKGRIIQK